MSVFDNLHYNYRFFLARPNKEIINELNVIQPVYSPQFKSIDELTFTLNYYENNWLQQKDINFDLIKNDYLILMEIRHNDTLKQSQYFIINEITENGIDEETKDIRCFSYEYILTRKNIRSYKNVSLLYDPTKQEQGILNYILDYKLNNDWTISYIDSSFIGVYRSFDIAEQTIIELFSDLERIYNCVFLYDTIDNNIQIKKLEDVGQNRDMILDPSNYLKNITVNTRTSDLITRYWFYGKNNISINKYNVTGQSYIDNFTFFRNSSYLSQDLLDALDDYDVVLETQKTVFTSYLDQLDDLNEDLLLRQNELADLNSELNIILDNEDIAIFNNDHTSYSTYRSQEIEKRDQISSKEAEINSLTSQISSVQYDINDLKNALSYQDNFTEKQIKEIQRFIKEKTITISNIDDEKTLYDYALYYVEQNKQPPVEFSVDSIDILSCSEHSDEWNKIQLADFININVERLNINYLPVRLVSYSHDISNNSLKLEFSSTNERNLEIDNWMFMMKKPQQVSNIVEVERDNYNSYIDEKGNIIYTGSILESITNPIIAPDGSEIGTRGFQFRQTVGDNYQMRIVGDKLCLTNDGWNTFSNVISGSGIEVERFDKKARVQIKPNNNIGFKIQKGNGYGSYTDTLYIDNDGNAVFSGTISASTIIGSTIIGGSLTVGTNYKLSITEQSLNGLINFSSLGGTSFASIGYNEHNLFIESDNRIYQHAGGVQIEGTNSLALASGGVMYGNASDITLTALEKDIRLNTPYGKAYYNNSEIAIKAHDHGNDYVKSYTGQNLSLVATESGIVIRVNGITLGSIFYD